MSIVESGYVTDAGLVRALNEDSLYVGTHIFAVADGMGGHSAGDVASRIAVGALATIDQRDVDETTLTSAAVQAHRSLQKYAAQHPDMDPPGTTITGVALVSESAGVHLCVFNLGDSRVYWTVDGNLQQLTMDHSHVQELVTAGLISPNQAREHPSRNVITRALGGPDEPEVDFLTVPFVAGSRVLICSDGLYGEVDDTDLRSELNAGTTAQECADALLARAVAAGAHDNVTAIVLDMRVADDVPAHVTVPRTKLETRGAE